jgi:hypothetical protein
MSAHWTLVNRQCTWSPRQGHASIAYRGGIYVLGGFDASGYCNDVYCLQVTAEMLQNEDPCVPAHHGHSDPHDGANSSSSLETSSVKHSEHQYQVTGAKTGAVLTKSVTVSMECVLESIAQLKQKRSCREQLIGSILSVVGFVREAVHGSSDTGAGDSDSVSDGLDPSPLSTPHSVILAKRGSPLRDVLLRSAHETTTKSVFSPKDVTTQSSHKQSLLGITRPSSGNELSAAAIIAESRHVRSRSMDTAGGSLSRLGMPKQDESSGYEFGDVENSGTSQESANVERIATPITMVSSAALRESIDKDRNRVLSLQRLIRQAAERGDDGELKALIDERTAVASDAVCVAKYLMDHIVVVNDLQNHRERFLSNSVKKLEDLCIKLFPSDDMANAENACSNGDETELGNSPESVLLTKWSILENECFAAVEAVNSEATELSIGRFCEDVKSLNNISSVIADWVDHTAAETTLFGLELIRPEQGPSIYSGFNNGSDKEGTADWKCGYEKICRQYDAVISSLDESKMEVKKSVDAELEALTKFDSSTQTLLKNVLSRGIILLRALLNQVLGDSLEIASMKTELTDWSELVLTLGNPVKLQSKIDSLLSEHAVMEEKLMFLEDKRIDLRSLLEKATLKGQRRAARPTFNMSLSSSSHDDVPAASSNILASSSNDDLEDIRFQLAEAERAVKDSRRAMRSWFRTVRKFAVSVAPELFRLLTDLQSPGSVLGDGGFAENAKLARRRLAEYDDIQPLVRAIIPPADLSRVAVPSADWSAMKPPLAVAPTAVRPASSASSAIALGTNSSGPPLPQKTMLGRHAILRATFDGEEVVLKGFVMQDGPQRRGFEREINILGRLQNDHIICPRAVVEDVGNYAVESNRTLQVAVYIEYSYYKGGNLSYWLKAAERKPWEMQGVARQLLYGLMYLHDHGVIHMVSWFMWLDDGTIIIGTLGYQAV